MILETVGETGRAIGTALLGLPWWLPVLFVGLRMRRSVFAAVRRRIGQ